jgi:carboxyl-terminal processing protease
MKNFARNFITVALAVFAAVVLFSSGLVVGHFTALSGFTWPSIPGLPVLAGSPSASGTPANLSTEFAPFWQAWGLVHQEYVDQPVNDGTLVQGAIRGMLDSLGDKHTLYESPQEYAVSDSSLSGQLEGIGAFVDKGNGGLLIVSTFAGSPAATAGLHANDLVVKVDNTDITQMDEIQAISLVRGPAGSVVHLTVIRAGSPQPLVFTITRAKIDVPSVESKMLSGSIAYLKINDFGTQTGDEVSTALNSLMKQQPHGLVLDLRNNPGGYLDAAVSVASQFLPGGKVVLKVKYGDGHIQTYNANSGGVATQIPMVVLIDGGSASASEILAGSLQDNQRAGLLGVTSYGKGTVQQVNQLVDNGGYIRVTIARWLTPLGRTIDQIGLTPNVVVPLSQDDRAGGRDPQLDRAVGILSGPAGAAATLAASTPAPIVTGTAPAATVTPAAP